MLRRFREITSAPTVDEFVRMSLMKKPAEHLFRLQNYDKINIQ